MPVHYKVVFNASPDRVVRQGAMGLLDAFRIAARDLEADNVGTAKDLVATHPGIGAIALECTNMTPHAAKVQSATAIPVFSHMSFVNWFQSSLSPTDWPCKA